MSRPIKVVWEGGGFRVARFPKNSKEARKFSGFGGMVVQVDKTPTNQQKPPKWEVLTDQGVAFQVVSRALYEAHWTNHLVMEP